MQVAQTFVPSDFTLMAWLPVSASVEPDRKPEQPASLDSVVPVNVAVAALSVCTVNIVNALAAGIATEDEVDN